MLRAQMLGQAAKVAHFLPSHPAIRFVSGTENFEASSLDLTP